MYRTSALLIINSFKLVVRAFTLWRYVYWFQIL